VAEAKAKETEEVQAVQAAEEAAEAAAAEWVEAAAAAAAEEAAFVQGHADVAATQTLAEAMQAALQEMQAQGA
jgi:hypothetical protein